MSTESNELPGKSLPSCSGSFKWLTVYLLAAPSRVVKERSLSTMVTAQVPVGVSLSMRYLKDSRARHSQGGQGPRSEELSFLPDHQHPNPTTCQRLPPSRTLQIATLQFEAPHPWPGRYTILLACLLQPPTKGIISDAAHVSRHLGFLMGQNGKSTHLNYPSRTDFTVHCDANRH